METNQEQTPNQVPDSELNRELVKIDTEIVCKQLEALIPPAYEELKTNPKIKVVRFIFDNCIGALVYEKNQDYLFRPSEAWKMVLIVNKDLLDEVYGEDNLDLFIKSKVLQWVSTCISKTFCKIEFYKRLEFDEKEYKDFVTHLPRIDILKIERINAIKDAIRNGSLAKMSKEMFDEWLKANEDLLGETGFEDFLPDLLSKKDS